MARPVCTSLDSPPADVDGAIVRVRDQNWQQGTGNGERLTEPRLVKSWSLDGGLTWGIPGPPPSSDPNVPVQGQVPAGQLTEFDFTGLFPEGATQMSVLFEIAAGTHSTYVRADGTTAYDVIEWGRTFLDDKPVRFSVVVKKAAPVTPPPEPPPPQQGDFVTLALRDVRAGLEHLRKSQGYKTTKANNPNTFLQTEMGKAESSFGSVEWHLDNRK